MFFLFNKKIYLIIFAFVFLWNINSVINNTDLEFYRTDAVTYNPEYYIIEPKIKLLNFTAIWFENHSSLAAEDKDYYNFIEDFIEIDDHILLITLESIFKSLNNYNGLEEPRVSQYYIIFNEIYKTLKLEIFNLISPFEYRNFLNICVKLNWEAELKKLHKHIQNRTRYFIRSLNTTEIVENSVFISTHNSEYGFTFKDNETANEILYDVHFILDLLFMRIKRINVAMFIDLNIIFVNLSKRLYNECNGLQDEINIIFEKYKTLTLKNFIDLNVTLRQKIGSKYSSVISRFLCQNFEEHIKNYKMNKIRPETVTIKIFENIEFSLDIAEDAFSALKQDLIENTVKNDFISNINQIAIMHIWYQKTLFGFSDYLTKCEQDTKHNLVANDLIKKFLKITTIAKYYFKQNKNRIRSFLSKEDTSNIIKGYAILKKTIRELQKNIEFHIKLDIQ